MLDMLDLHYASIQDIHRLYREKQLTVRALVLSFLKRIADIDACDGGLNSVLEINPDALFIADAMDRRLRDGDGLSHAPFFGIPVFLKDNVNTKDRLHTSAGSVALAGNYAPYDAHIAKLLRRAGALILGKANMTEFANYMSDANMPSGYSSRGGQVLNPYNRGETPNGSSSGSAVAVAAGLCTVSIGTETCGSIISPAGCNGIVGIKPTLGLVGRSGIIPISGTLDTAGPMARSVRDAAVLLGAIAGIDPDDPATHSASCGAAVDYTQCLDPDGLKKAKIGIVRSQGQDDSDATEEEKASFDGLCGILARAGATIAEGIEIESKLNIGDIMRYEFKSCMNYYLSTLDGRAGVNTLKDIIQYNQTNAPVALKYGQGVLLNAENRASGTLTEPEYIGALLEREKAAKSLDNIFAEHGVDVLLCDTMQIIAPLTGFPSMTIPVGQCKNNVPLSTYWIARRYDEASLLSATYALEQQLGLCIKPDLS